MTNKSRDDAEKEIWNKYKNKQPLSKDEFLYVICRFNPDYDGPATLESYLKKYDSYMLNELKNLG